uniref:Uncharacterized protein n=1 Tax=Tanacetum cinerariifolium TaxID=118510 RepID=A0A699QEV2_TANCI|nr:hypothetical protein [Tanacetum cinerariifolium]
MEDQPLPTDASPIALSPDYVVNSTDEKDPKEDLAYYHADPGNNEDDEIAKCENDEDDVEGGREEEEGEEDSAPGPPSGIDR